MPSFLSIARAISAGRQLPERGEMYLDHVGWMVPDMDAAARAFTRLGFALTPYSPHGNRDPETGRIVPQGSANRLAMLERGYLEILTPVAGADTAMARHLKDSMERYVGVHLIAFAVADAPAEAERLAGAGFRLQPTVDLRRTIEAADGSEVQVAFTVVRPRFGSIPEGRLQVLAHLTPEHLWQARYIARDNAITGLCEVVLAVPDPASSSQMLTRFTGRGGRLGLARSGPDPRLPARTRGTPPGRRARAPDRRPARRHGRSAGHRAGTERLTGSPPQECENSARPGVGRRARRMLPDSASVM